MHGKINIKCMALEANIMYGIFRWTISERPMHRFARQSGTPGVTFYSLSAPMYLCRNDKENTNILEYTLS